MNARRARIACPAKVNLYLDVLGRRPDGFHDLDSVFLAIDLADELHAEVSGAGADALVVEGPFADGAPPDGRNLVLQAMALLRREGEVPPLRLRLVKNVPAQAGLGGGSSDGARALLLGSRFMGAPPQPERLARLAEDLGSDCPFFLGPGAARVGGRGERRRRLVACRGPGLLLVVPQVSIPTGPAFGWLEEGDMGPRTDGNAVERWLAGDNVEIPRLGNSFERPVSARFPEVAATLEALRALRPRAALMSGSGSACLAVMDDVAEAREAAAAWRLPARLVRACGTLAL